MINQIGGCQNYAPMREAMRKKSEKRQIEDRDGRMGCDFKSIRQLFSIKMQEAAIVRLI